MSPSRIRTSTAFCPDRNTGRLPGMLCVLGTGPEDGREADGASLALVRSMRNLSYMLVASGSKRSQGWSGSRVGSCRRCWHQPVGRPSKQLGLHMQPGEIDQLGRRTVVRAVEAGKGGAPDPGIEAYDGMGGVDLRVQPLWTVNRMKWASRVRSVRPGGGSCATPYGRGIGAMTGSSANGMRAGFTRFPGLEPRWPPLFLSSRCWQPRRSEPWRHASVPVGFLRQQRDSIAGVR